MKYLQTYYTSIIKYDLFNKFLYTQSEKIPKLEKIVLNFGCKCSDLKILATCSLALQLITEKKNVLTQAKKSNILLKIRRGDPVGCKVILKKQLMYLFLYKLTTEFFPKKKLIDTIIFRDNFTNTRTLSYKISNILLFSELEKNYYLFRNISNLQITFITNTKTIKELVYILNCFKLPFSTNNCKCNSIGRV